MARRLPWLVISLALAAPGAAHAATLTPDRACYRTSQMMQLTVAGFPAGDAISFTGNQVPLRAGYLNGEEQILTGDGTIPIQALTADETFIGPEPLALEAQSTRSDDQGNNVTTAATATVQLIDYFSARATPRATTKRPSRKVRYRVRGAVELTPVYLHVTRQRNGPRPGRATTKTIKLGTPSGPCGMLDVRAPQLGGMRVRRHSIYSRQIDLSPRTDPSSDSQTRANLGAIFVP
jgi:hypothetical protein